MLWNNIKAELDSALEMLWRFTKVPQMGFQMIDHGIKFILKRVGAAFSLYKTLYHMAISFSFEIHSPNIKDVLFCKYCDKWHVDCRHSHTPRQKY